jgi:hypothetical protein
VLKELEAEEKENSHTPGYTGAAKFVFTGIEIEMDQYVATTCFASRIIFL